MKVKLDENLPTALAELFRASGYDAMTVADEALGGGRILKSCGWQIPRTVYS